jgi:tetratricopeptide (TPR) repeat protein
VLFDMDLLAGKLEDLYGEMIAEYQAGQRPRPNVANLEAYLDVGIALDRDDREMLVESVASGPKTTSRPPSAGTHEDPPMTREPIEAALKRRADVLALAERLRDEGRHDDAIILFEHLLDEAGDPYATWVALSQTHLAAGRVLEAMRALVEAKAFCAQVTTMWPLIAEQTARGSQAFNAALQRNDLAEAETYVSVIAQLTPGNPQTIGAAMGCNQALGRTERPWTMPVGWSLWIRAMWGADPPGR